MDPDLEPIYIRQRRVQSQIRRIEANYRAFAPRLKDYRFSMDVDEGATKHIERIHMAWVIPEAWAVQLGEVMHNLRSTLDNLVCQLVLAEGNKPGNQHEFPVAHEESWYEKRAPEKLAGIPGWARQIIDKVQPYKGPTPALHPLWIVHNLNRLDKHQGLHVVAAYSDGEQFEVTPEMAAVKGQMRLWYRPLENGTEVRSFTTLHPFHGNVPMGDVIPLQVVVRETDETPFYPFPGIARFGADGVNEVVRAIAERREV